MKKTTIILISLLMAFVIMSGGYGLWSKDVVIEGDIQVVPDPNVIASLEATIEKKYEEIDLLLEEQRILEELKELEEQEENDEDIELDEEAEENDEPKEVHDPEESVEEVIIEIINPDVTDEDEDNEEVENNEIDEVDEDDYLGQISQP